MSEGLEGWLEEQVKAARVREQRPGPDSRRVNAAERRAFAEVLHKLQDHPEPRYTEEQIREGLLSEGMKEALVEFLDAWRYCPVSAASSPSRQCLEDAAAQLLDTLAGPLACAIRKPAGVGADGGIRPSQQARGARGTPGVSADSDGNQQPLGGDADGRDRVREDSKTRTHVAEGGSGQGAGSAPLGQFQVCECQHLLRDHGPDGCAYKSYCGCNRVRALACGVYAPPSSTQHPSGGQEAPKIERTSELLHECANAVAASRKEGCSEWATACSVIAAIERTWDGRSAQAERERIGGQEGGVEEGADCDCDLWQWPGHRFDCERGKA